MKLEEIKVKKRNLFLSLVLALSLFVTACGQSNPFVGTWRGTCDFTDFILEVISEGDESIEEYIDFEKLELVLIYEFTEDEVSMHVDEESINTFVENVETGIAEAMEVKFIGDLETQGIDYEEYIEEMGMDRDEFLDSMLEDMNITAWTESIYQLAEVLELHGTYIYDDDVLMILYEDGTYEEMTYVFNDEMLTITISDGAGTEFPIQCELVK